MIKLDSDAEIIYDIMMDAFSEYKTDPMPSSALNETVASISRNLESGELALVGYLDQEPVAMVRFKLADNYLYFSRLSVKQAFQGTGMAKKLLHALEGFSLSKEIYEIQCKVRKSVPRNLMLYESLGYEIYDEDDITNANGDIIKTVSMRKLLKNQAKQKLG
ncbi:GNAT family N-acetyltransferase [Lysinibacillus sp. 54212]|uniref:GNAT family N-acetyltransferase n=1 Tax=Lysinibacillus sp. 54212 TaxID=3119829 RepID=UPI002FC9F9A6